MSAFHLCDRKKRISVKQNKGFSLIEVLICIVILAIIVIPVLNSFRSAAVMNSKAHRLQAATSEAQNIMEKFNSNPVSIMKSIYEDPANILLGYQYEEYWPTAAFDVAVDLHGAPEECYRILSFYREGYVSENGAVYDYEVILNPNSYSSNAAGVTDASNTNTNLLPQIENIDSISNAVISTEMNKYDDSAVGDLGGNPDKKEVTVLLSRSATGSLRVTCSIIYYRGTTQTEYTVYQNNFIPTLNADGTDWESGGDIYLFVHALTNGNDSIKMINTYSTTAEPNLDIHFIRNGDAGNYNIGKILLSDSINTDTYLNIYGTQVQKCPSGYANVYHMDFTSNVKSSTDPSGDAISQASVLTTDDVAQYEANETASLRCYTITVRLYREGTFSSYGHIGDPGTLSDSLGTAMTDNIVVTIDSTVGVSE